MKKNTTKNRKPSDKKKPVAKVRKPSKKQLKDLVGGIISEVVMY